MPEQQSLEEVVAVSEVSASSSRSERSDPGEAVELNETQRELVETMRQVAWTTIADGKPIRGLVEHWVADTFAQILTLKQRRNRAVQHGDLARAQELNNEIEERQCTLKQAGLPYHPAMDGNRDDYRRLPVHGPEC